MGGIKEIIAPIIKAPGDRSEIVAAVIANLMRLSLGLLFLFSGLVKVRSPFDFLASVYDYQLLSPQPSLVIAAVLPWLEIVVATCLLGNLMVPGAFFVVSGMSSVFVGVVSWALYRQLNIKCGCFLSNDLISCGTLVRAASVLLAAIVGLLLSIRNEWREIPQTRLGPLVTKKSLVLQNGLAFTVLAASATVGVWYIGTQSGTEVIQWNDDIAAARREALNTGKPILLEFSATWCGPCENMKQTTFQDSAVISLLRHYVVVSIDFDSNPDLVHKLDITAVPTFVVADAKTGHVIKGHHVGAMTPEQFRSWLNAN